MRRTRVLAAVAVAVGVAGVAAFGWRRYAPRSTPAGQPALAVLSQEGFARFTAGFDSAGGAKILALLSPT